MTTLNTHTQAHLSTVPRYNGRISPACLTDTYMMTVDTTDEYLCQQYTKLCAVENRLALMNPGTVGYESAEYESKIIQSRIREWTA